MKIKFLMCFYLCGIMCNVFAQEIEVDAIPYKMHFENSPTEYKVLGDDCLRIVAQSKTNLFISPDGGYEADTAPKLLFEPEADFILSAKIKLDFKSNWDAGVLLIYNDSKHYAKYCFESDYQGTPRVVTVVCNEVGDDCNSMKVPSNEVYYRIAGSKESKTFGFYYSEDQKHWYLIRSFRLNKTDHLRIGFSAQSPVGDGCNVDFTEIDLQERKINDFWQGD